MKFTIPLFFAACLLQSQTVPAPDQQAAIGRRYRRMDEIGTPFCITVDGDTMAGDAAKLDTVTIRDRDTLEQIRVPVKELVEHVRSRLRG